MRRLFIITVRNAIAPLALILAAAVGSPASAQDAFATPDEAVTALVNAVRSDDPGEAIVKLLGPDGRDVASSGDEIDDQARRGRFLSSFDEGHSLQADGDKQYARARQG